VKTPGIVDNPLHLAIRCKDSHIVEAILERGKQHEEVHEYGQRSKITHKSNRSGFTPILFAFTIFSFTGEGMEQELRIVKLLLKYGAKPNDQGATHSNTPLHLVVSVSQSTIALELLCRNHADPDIPNASGTTALDLTWMRRDCSVTVAAEKCGMCWERYILTGTFLAPVLRTFGI
jgi:ankyrin repeat protein